MISTMHFGYFDELRQYGRRSSRLSLEYDIGIDGTVDPAETATFDCRW